MSINGFEWVVLAVLAIALLGPNRLPEYAAGLARLIRQARTFALGAREQVRDELGPEFDEVDWKKYDPRRYHPRQIVRNALAEAWEGEDEPGTKPVSPGGPAGRSSTATTTAAARSAAASGKPSAATSAGARSSAAKATAARPAAGASKTTGAVRRPPRSPRPAALPQATQPSPAPTTWSAATQQVAFDADAT